jgi:trehalose 6-phosphate phosphatase
MRLARHPRVTVAVISGRRRAELLRLINLEGIGYFGLYGWESRPQCDLPASTLAALRRARLQLSIHLSSIRGLWTEDKRFSLSVHLLEVPAADQTRARRKVREALLPYRNRLRIIENLRDIEIVPRSIMGKGLAVQQFLAKPALSQALPIYFGDDFSDEPAFKAVRAGISIRVGAPRLTSARYSLQGPAAVTKIFSKLEAALS